jgi:hypothetical protein
MSPLRHAAACIACLVVLAGCAGAPWEPPPAFDHYDPVALRAAATEREAAGDHATATVLRARAARLAPHEPRAAPAKAPAVAPSPTPAAPPAVLPEPPALWPVR